MSDFDVVESDTECVESEVEKVVQKLTKNKVVKENLVDVKKKEKAERISKGRKLGAMTRNKKTDELRKKSLLFDKYLQNELTYEEIIENGFKMKNVEPTKVSIGNNVPTALPNVIIAKTKELQEPVKASTASGFKQVVKRKKVVKKVMPKVKVEPIKSNGKMSYQELDDFLNS